MSTPTPGRQSTSQIIKQAVANQSANLTQKALLDVSQTKLILLLKEVAVAESVEGSALTVGDALVQYDMHIKEMRRIVSMTRDEVSSIRPNFEFPDEKVQAILSKAIDEITDVILES